MSKNITSRLFDFQLSLKLTVLLLLFFSNCHGRKSSTYEIGIDPSWYPLEAIGQEKNIFAFSVDLLTEIAKIESMQISILKMNPNNLLFNLDAKNYDAILSTMRPYTFNLKNYAFSELFLKTGPVLIVPKDSKIEGIKTVRGKKIGVVKGSSATVILQTLPGIILEGFDSAPETLIALEQKEVDGVAIGVLLAQNYVQNLYTDQIKIVTDPLDAEGLRLITLTSFKRSANLIHHFNSGLTIYKKSGKYERLLKKWGLSPDGKSLSLHNKQIDSFLNQHPAIR